MKNLHVAASADAQSRRLTMLYALRPGACAQSFGIHCAEFARFPAEVLAAARAKAAAASGAEADAASTRAVQLSP